MITNIQKDAQTSEIYIAIFFLIATNRPKSALSQGLLISKKKSRPCRPTYNVTLWCVRITIVVKETQDYLLCVFVSVTVSNIIIKTFCHKKKLCVPLVLLSQMSNTKVFKFAKYEIFCASQQCKHIWNFM